MQVPKRLLVENIAWAREMVRRDPGFFARLTARQQPEVLWIGCSDSRVPAESITNAQPGDLFVHRNIANLVLDEDPSLMSVLQYALIVLQVKHIVICGHHNCGGVRAALQPDVQALTFVTPRLALLRILAQRHKQALDALLDIEQRVDHLVEINVVEQIRKLADTSIVRDAYRNGHSLTLHGWVYGLRNGLLKEICAVDAQGQFKL